MQVSLEVLHLLISWLNVLAPPNIKDVPLTLEMLHMLASWLKAPASLNI